MSKSKIVQCRIPEKLIDQLDKLCEEGIYRNRTEAITDAIRRLLENNISESEFSKTINKYITGNLPRSKNINDLPMLTEEESIKLMDLFKTRFGTTVPEQVIQKMRSGLE